MVIDRATTHLDWPGLVAGLNTLVRLKPPASAESLDTDQLPVAFEVCENLFSLNWIWVRSRTPTAFVPREEERRAHDILRGSLNDTCAQPRKSSSPPAFGHLAKAAELAFETGLGR